jgi:hypothetical protein
LKKSSILKILEKSLAKRKTLEKSLAEFEWQDLVQVLCFAKDF